MDHFEFNLSVLYIHIWDLFFYLFSERKCKGRSYHTSGVSIALESDLSELQEWVTGGSCTVMCTESHSWAKYFWILFCSSHFAGREDCWCSSAVCGSGQCPFLTCEKQQVLSWKEGELQRWEPSIPNHWSPFRESEWLAYIGIPPPDFTSPSGQLEKA